MITKKRFRELLIAAGASPSSPEMEAAERVLEISPGLLDHLVETHSKPKSGALPLRYIQKPDPDSNL
jgi:hypothetical protein